MLNMDLKGIGDESMIMELLFVIGIWLGTCIFMGLFEEYTTPKYSEDCYYCKYSKYPRSLRDKNKNTCNLINNKGWSSEHIRHCEYRVVE